MSKRWFEKTKRVFDKVGPLHHDEVLLHTTHNGIIIRQIRGEAGELRITVGANYGGCEVPTPSLFFRGDRLDAANLLEECARALRTLP